MKKRIKNKFRNFVIGVCFFNFFHFTLPFFGHIILGV